jgi:hypothetical protein
LVRQANAIDFWRGFALITIFINHIPGIFFESFTHRNISISDSAELFVFLAGWALFLTSEGGKTRKSTGRVLSRLGGRAISIYAAQILISSIAIATLAVAARMLQNPLLLEWHNAAAAFYDPIPAQIGLVALTYQLGYFDILPLYVVLMLSAPIVVLIHRYATRLLFPISLLIYFVALVFRISIPSWPTEGHWFFNPLSWQLVFVLGFVVAHSQGGGSFYQRHIFWIRIAALCIVISGVVIVFFEWWPDPLEVPEPTFLFIIFKPYATPLRLIQFIALVIVFSGVFTEIQRFSSWLANFSSRIRWVSFFSVSFLLSFISKTLSLFLYYITHFFSKLGRNSLNVFCVGSLLSLFSQILRFYFEGTLFIDIIVVVAGIALLGLTAWLSEWSKNTKRA